MELGSLYSTKLVYVTYLKLLLKIIEVAAYLKLLMIAMSFLLMGLFICGDERNIWIETLVRIRGQHGELILSLKNGIWSASLDELKQLGNDSF